MRNIILNINIFFWYNQFKIQKQSIYNHNLKMCECVNVMLHETYYQCSNVINHQERFRFFWLVHSFKHDKWSDMFCLTAFLSDIWRTPPVFYIKNVLTDLDDYFLNEGNVPGPDQFILVEFSKGEESVFYLI